MAGQEARQRLAMTKRLLDLREAADEYGFSIWTLRDLIAKGALPAVRPPGLRRVFVERRALDQAVERWTERANG